MSKADRVQFFDEVRDPSRIKLRIYEKYLVPWASKVGSPPSESTLWVIDGFAGPGIYQDEAQTPGSPKLILDHARDALQNEAAHYRIRCIFVEKVPKNYRQLVTLCDQYPDVESHVIPGDFWEQIEKLSEMVSQEPLLLITDPFGVKGIDYRKLARLANASRKCDLIVTFVNSAVPRLEGQWPADVETAIGTMLPSDDSAAATFARNMSAEANFLPAGRFPVRASFKSAGAYELIVFSRSIHAYRLWNDLVTLEWQEQRRRYQSSSREDKPLLPGLEEAFAEVTAERDRREAANAILVWANEHRSFTRTELIDDFVVHRFAKYHSSSLKAALKWLKSLDKLDEEPTSKGRKADARRWQVLDLAPV